jgi:hypothetical protein
VRGEHQLLVDDSDAQLMHARGRRVFDQLPAHANLAAVGCDRAREDLDERGFSSAILAHEPVDFTASEDEVDVAQGNDAGVALVNPGHRENRFARGTELWRCSRPHPHPFLFSYYMINVE